MQISESRECGMKFLLTTAKEICPGASPCWHRARTPLKDQRNDSLSSFRKEAMYGKWKAVPISFRKAWEMN